MIGPIFHGNEPMLSDERGPRSPGVYFIMSGASEVPFEYIGSAKSLWNRMADHRSGRVSPMSRVAYDVLLASLGIDPLDLEEEAERILGAYEREGWRIGWVEMRTAKAAREAEKALVRIYQPPMNRRHTYAESLIRKDLVGTVESGFECIAWVSYKGQMKPGRSTGVWLWKCQKCGREVKGNQASIRTRRAPCKGCANGDGEHRTPGNTVEMAGEQYDDLTVLERAQRTGSGPNAEWACRCVCGNEVVRTRLQLLEGWRLYCDACDPNTHHGDLAGLESGRLTLIAEMPGKRVGGQAVRQWLCICECGTWRIVIQPTLVGGRSKSCGCLQKETARGRPRDSITGQFT